MRSFQGFDGTCEYGFAMRGENVLDVQSLQSLTQPRSHSIRIQPDEPLRWTEGKSVLRSEQNVARHEGRVRGKPKEHLVGASGIDRENLLPGYIRPLLRVVDYLAFLEQHTDGRTRVR